MAVLAPVPSCFAPRGMVTSIDHLATAAGVSILRAGGSAADAAVATNAVLAVTSQHLCGLGGDLFALVHPAGGEPVALNASGRSGSGADADRLRAEGARVMPFRGDVRAVPVPGCVDGWLALHARFGLLPLAAVLEPARLLAADGFPASVTLAGAVGVLAAAGGDGLDLFLADGPLRPGRRVRRPGVARALAAIAADGRAGFYEGEFGAGLLALGAGEYEPGDLAAPNADWVAPVRLHAFGHDLVTVPPNSQGYLTLASAWIADRLELPADPDDPRWAHLLVEASKQAGHDRPAVLHEHADAAALLDPARLQARLDRIDPERATPVPGRWADGGTVHLNAVDADGTVVSLTQSNAAGFGSHLVVPGVRIALQNRGLGFSLEPGHPAEYGPRRRPPHTLSPLLVTTADGRPRAALGTMGADSQPQILLQLLARILRRGEDPATAVAAGRFTLATPDVGQFAVWEDPAALRVRVEGHAPPAWPDGLRARGHAVDVGRPFDALAGHAHVILVEDDHVAGAADPRALGGSAAGC